MLQNVLLIVVVLGWLLYIGSWLRARTENRRSNSIHSFSKHLSVLANTAPVQSSTSRANRGAAVIPLRGAPFAPIPSRNLTGLPTLATIRRRRRDILAGLGGAALVSALLTVAVGGPFSVLFLVTAAAFVAYAGLLYRAQRIGTERSEKVRYLPQPAVSSEAPLLLQRRAN